MATSSSDGSCTAPTELQISSDLEEVSSRLSLNLLKCPLCLNRRRIFHCRQCIQNGDFVHSTSVCSERYADKQLRLLRLKAAKLLSEEECNKAFEKAKQKDKLIHEITTHRQRMKKMSTLVKAARESLASAQNTLLELTDANTDLVIKLVQNKEWIEKVQQTIVELGDLREVQILAIDKTQQQLKKVVRRATKQLMNYIFPITQVDPNRSLYCNESGNLIADIVTCALADASGTTYVRGEWINDTENSVEMQYRIVAPTLPGSGDYSAYLRWAAANKDGAPSGSKEHTRHNPGYNISAALTYTTQLVNMIAYYVKVRLPYKIAYSDFCGTELSGKKFVWKVARLNSNVLHLCLSQNTNPALLHPLHTLQNLLHLLNTDVTELGRSGPMEVDTSILNEMHSQLVADLEHSDDSASDEEEDPINWEWEAVPNVPCPEMAVPYPGGPMRSQSSSMQGHQSVAGGLVTSAAASIASLWRGWTNNR